MMQKRQASGGKKRGKFREEMIWNGRRKGTGQELVIDEAPRRMGRR